MWIESLNTVMDDSKVLTLASNERVPLTPSMRLMIPALSTQLILDGHYTCRVGLKNARCSQRRPANLSILFDHYIPILLDAMCSGCFKKITLIQEVSMIQTLCYLLEAILTPQNVPPDTTKEIYALYFVFAAIWAFGGSTFQDQLVDYHVEFSKWWVTEFKQLKFPSQGTVFDYFLDHKTKKWLPWSEKIPKFELAPAVGDCAHSRDDVPPLLPGPPRGQPSCCYTTSLMLQQIIEKPLEKKAGPNYGPPGTKKLIYFLDDINMPAVDAYSTMQPHTLIRQHLDYQHWYDRQKLTLKEIHNVQYVACMNPTAGSFTIDTRLQRHFQCVFCELKTIYSSRQQVVKSQERLVVAKLHPHPSHFKSHSG
eukprot:Em0010g665a